MHPLVESLLSARLFLNPEVAGEHLYFASDLSGRMSLHRMRRGASVPEPLIPGAVAPYEVHLLPPASKGRKARGVGIRSPRPYPMRLSG